MYVKRHEQFEIGCGAILNNIYYYYLKLFYESSFIVRAMMMYNNCKYIDTYNVKNTVHN